MTDLEATVVHRKVLIVEDNDITRKMMRIALEAEGYKVLEAPNGATAVALMTRRPEVVILDVILPDCLGFELVGTLRAGPGGAGVPMIACSGFASTQEAELKVMEAFDIVLTKPVEPSHLVATVRSQLPVDPPMTTRSGEARRLLLVDDDPVQLKLNRIGFSQLGFEVFTACDGVEGLERARESRPDVILSDVLMPRMDGFLLCAAIRADEKLGSVPVVLQTANYLEKSDHDLASRAGAHSLIPRAAGMNQTLELVLNSLDSPPPARLPQSAVEDDYTGRIVKQLERQVAASQQWAKRCSLQSAILSVTNTLNNSLASGANFDRALSRSMYQLLDLSGLSRSAIYLRGDDRLVHVAASSGYLPNEAESLRTCFGELWLLNRSIDSRDPILITPSGTCDADAPSFIAGASIASAISAPLLSGGHSSGALFLASNEQALDSPEWIDFARILGGHIGHAIAISRLLSIQSLATASGNRNAGAVIFTA